MAELKLAKGDLLAPSVLVINNGIAKDYVLDYLADNKIKYKYEGAMVYPLGGFSGLELTWIKIKYMEAYQLSEVIEYQHELDSENLETTKGKCMGCDEVVEFKWIPIKELNIEDVAECPECGMMYSNTAFVDPSEIGEVE